MVKVIVAKQKYDASHLLGQFVDERHYDVLVEEDCDVYAPPSCDLGEQAACTQDCTTCDKGTDERKIIFKFRKNYFSKEMQEQAYLGLREAATETQNRGIAAGPREGKLGNREWVTDYEFDVIDYFSNPKNNLFGSDPIEEIKAAHKNKPPQPSNKNNVWSIQAVKEDEFDFERWVASVKDLQPAEQKEETRKMVQKYICQTTYANGVMSGIAGWYDRYPRIPYGRATSYTEQNPEKFAKSYPYLEHLSEAFQELLPWRYGNQKRAADKVDPRFLVPGTPFSTITVNRNFRTAAHYDPANMDDGFANICVFSNSDNYRGAYLVFPEIGYAVNIRPGDLLFVNNMAGLHGNTELILDDPNAERISIIAFFHEGMLTLGSMEYENARRKYVDWCRMNVNHPYYKPRFNGVWPGMWESKEWYDFCEKEVGREELLKMHPEANASSLDEFFA